MFGPDHADAFIANLRVADAYFALDEFLVAEQYISAAIEVVERLGLKSTIHYANVRRRHSAISLKLNRPQVAEESAISAVALHRRLQAGLWPQGLRTLAEAFRANAPSIRLSPGGLRPRRANFRFIEQRHNTELKIFEHPSHA